MTDAIAKSDELPSETFPVLGVRISVTNLETAARRIESWASDDQGRFVCVRDVASLMTMIDDPKLARIHDKAAMITPDGMPLVLIGRLRGLPVARTCGPDLFDLVMRRSQANGLKHYFYGGKEGVAEKLAAIVREKYIGTKIVGWECPPFRQPTADEEAETIQRITASGADVVWVGISSPKQEIWMHRVHSSLTQTLIGVGAAFDFHTGSIGRAPLWMQHSGLEWLYRLCSEPRRLWRRYLILAPAFVFRAAYELVLQRTR